MSKALTIHGADGKIKREGSSNYLKTLTIEAQRRQIHLQNLSGKRQPVIHQSSFNFKYATDKRDSSSARRGLKPLDEDEEIKKDKKKKDKKDKKKKKGIK